ncbi:MULTISPECIES: phage gp6-like head-tail connector protein [unclassified Methylobacterium]|uniref:phage gp6-like head-tail connector protein n=1 Tax=unclassified Methylobacterium TaxID=2615210 RepID=UPI0005B852DE|nr:MULTISPECIES: phage gp6-like head-tail connector protein [unclassified Methylobacterium]SFU82185.1 hypothetical protein SAMN02799643_02542 [Methylobacterium sp. UNCCL125]
MLETAFPADLDPDDRVYPCPPAMCLVNETPDQESGPVTVCYRAGYPVVDGRSTVPAPIRHAILLMVGHLRDLRKIGWGLASAVLLAFGGIMLAKIGLAGR